MEGDSEGLDASRKQNKLYAPMAGQGDLLYDRDAVYITMPANQAAAKPIAPVQEEESEEESDGAEAPFSLMAGMSMSVSQQLNAVGQRQGEGEEEEDSEDERERGEEGVLEREGIDLSAIQGVSFNASGEAVLKMEEQQEAEVVEEEESEEEDKKEAEKEKGRKEEAEKEPQDDDTVTYQLLKARARLQSLVYAPVDSGDVYRRLVMSGELVDPGCDIAKATPEGKEAGAGADAPVSTSKQGSRVSRGLEALLNAHLQGADSVNKDQSVFGKTEDEEEDGAKTSDPSLPVSVAAATTPLEWDGSAYRYPPAEMDSEEGEEGEEGEEKAQGAAGVEARFKRFFVTGDWAAEAEDDQAIKDALENDEVPMGEAGVGQGYGEEEEGEEMDTKFDDDKRERQKAIKEANRSFKDGSLEEGTYCRVLLQGVPAELLATYTGTAPLILGSVFGGTDTVVTARVKPHRWCGRIFRFEDPLIVSVGWYRLQSIPLYSSVKNEGVFLKYTPRNSHCETHFPCPGVTPNTAVMAIHNTSETSANFRVAWTGVALSTSAQPPIRKRLKLIGYPDKIHKNTAVVRGLFSSQEEASIFQGIGVRTQSGLRGIVKKAVDDTGRVRATFEDRVQLSDVVFASTWVPVKVRGFAVHVQNHLSDDVPLLRSRAQIRMDTEQTVPFKPSSVYKEVGERPPDRKANLKVPKKLAAALPFQSKPKYKAKLNGYLKGRTVISDEQRRDDTLLSAVHTVRKAREKEEHKKREARKKRLAKEALEKPVLSSKGKEAKKRMYREMATAENKQIRRRQFIQ
ncbi:hypothetical protein KIPB_002424 [Kipferlia bialata]|uniref:Ribosome biogenesis protein BMS1/TSR1 C-terminal domain-containing protein n=1 Tax=Kipferlia bialata TaxID=797122 RepID=A0A9K3GEY3_9EUKA|nr:hypothetical protein KIPB_002424 [Kipferlia bialata]|eukprot:g2424.t1